MSTPKAPSCARCGAELTAFAANGFCAACLLEQGLSSKVPATTPPFSRVGDYELIEEIARGGMGVVYKARQVSLGRIVALKMILSGHLASQADLLRFRKEAETIARLQHPNIVAIHDVGEFDAQPFFSMDYVEGRNLAEMVRERPLSASVAARYVKIIAEAVHYAHERGVLHRDLKPSNVLVDGSDQPRVTDFGVAKQLAGDSDLTLTGQVIGSPNYMPPEQAAAKHGDLTPASDVYSLGAILYHCLTVRPPFVGETIAATLRMVAENDPVSPRLLNADVPRDLETICLKCLEKDSKRRYATAHELGEELERFLNDVPLLAQPSGPVNRLRRWCRRKPALCALSASVALLLLTIFIGARTVSREDLTDPESPWTVRYYGLIDLALVLQKDNRLDEAHDAFTKAVELVLNDKAVPDDVRSDALLKRSKLLVQMGRHAAARRDFLRGESIPARDPKCPVGAVDLTAYYNAGFTRDWQNETEGNTLSNLPAGLQEFVGVQFDVRGLIQLSSERTKSWKNQNFPPALRQIKIGRSCRRLHFLHAATEGGGHGEVVVGSYVVRFANQQTWEIPLVYCRDLHDWWLVGGEPKEATEAVIAWEGNNAAAKKKGSSLRLFKRTWASPLLDEITTIDFVSRPSGPAPFLIAITLE